MKLKIILAAGGRNAGRSVSFDTNIRGPRNVPGRIQVF